MLMVIEFVGGICIALGLFTRFFAAAAAIEMAVLTFYIYWANGYSWTARGYEFTLLWGVVLFAIALRGGGPLSLDRKIGREL
jgi:putative oxidoreductase